MAKVKIDGLDLLRDDMEKFAQKACAYAAGMVADEMTDAMSDIVNEFYGDYTPAPPPKGYRRHYFNLRDNSFRRYYSNPHGEKMTGGIQFTPERMEELYLRGRSSPASANLIFSEFMLGMHGDVSAFPYPPKKIPPVMSPSPMSLIMEKYDDIVSRIDEYAERGKEKAKKDSYVLLQVK